MEKQRFWTIHSNLLLHKCEQYYERQNDLKTLVLFDEIPTQQIKKCIFPGIRAKTNISTSLHTTHTETHHLHTTSSGENTKTTALSLI